MKTASILSPGLFKSSLRRFWPLWLAGLVGLVLLFDVPLYGATSSIVRDNQYLADQRASMASLWSFMRLFAWCYAMVGSFTVALALHEHLFDARSATFMGSLPLRRPTIFISVVLAGMLVLFALPALGCAFLLPLYFTFRQVLALDAVARWYGLVAFSVVVLYAVALVSCQLAGTRPVAGLLYLVIGFLAVCLEAALELIVAALVYGLSGLESVLDWASPAAWVLRAALSWMEADSLVTPAGIAGYLIAAALAFLLAGWLFCHRDLEKAGDSVAVAPLRPVLKYLAGFSMALLFGAVFRLTRYDAFSELPLEQGEVVSLTLLMVLGGVLGVLFAEMIMRRSTRVLAHCGRAGLVVAAVVVAFVAVCRFDLTGAGHFVPDPAEVEKVELEGNYCNPFTLSSPESVAAVCDLQRDVIAYGGAGERGESTFPLTISYHLKGGRVVHRAYPIVSDWFDYDYLEEDRLNEGDRLVAQFAKLADSEEGRAARFATVLDADISHKTFVFEYQVDDGDYMQSIEVPEQDRASLVEALRQDLMEEAAGTVMSQMSWIGGYDAFLEVRRLDPSSREVQSVHSMQLSDKDCPHTVAWFKEHYPKAELILLEEES